MKHLIKIVPLFLFIGIIFSQRQPSNTGMSGNPLKGNNFIRQYQLSVYTVASESSDSIRVLSYLSIPNHVLQFVKSSKGFKASYEATISIKRKKGDLVGRKNWSNDLITKTYLESTSKEIFNIHFNEFRVPLGEDYIISAELLDRDSNSSGIISKNLKLKKHSKDLSLYSPFFLDYLNGDWGLIDNEIPLFRNILGEQLVRTTVFVSGKVSPGPYEIDVIVTNPKKQQLWEKTFQSVAQNNYFEKRIIIPDEISQQGLRSKVDIILKQNGKQKKESVILSISRLGISSSVGNISQAIQNMRYILDDDEWKKLSKAKSDEQERLFIEYWLSRDPTPETKENELMDEYFSRINYSNVNFKTYTDGWKSDMGMIYVLFGPPDDLEVYNDPLSRMYQQRWHYYRINKFFDFVDENGFGDYKLTTPFFRARSW
ncbi:MAG: GWxTD domain-containing protein [Candidatus Neomarinimicrobiota bacterium]|nr:GWxTD domain-containing protein [Candidatus Neomarinimicrobiota bacterium]